jgi:hypothetical protein
LFPLAVWTPALNPSAQIVTMNRTSKDFFMLNTLSEFTGVTRGVARLTGAGRPAQCSAATGSPPPSPGDKRTKEDFTNRLMAQEMRAGPGPAGAKSAIAPALEDEPLLVAGPAVSLGRREELPLDRTWEPRSN